MKTSLILFDDSNRIDLLPLTFTRPVADIRLGILNIREKWEMMLGMPSSSLTESYLAGKFPLRTAEENLLVNAAVLPDAALVERIRTMQPGEALVQDECILAQCVKEEELADAENRKKPATLIAWDNPLRKLSRPWDVFRMNAEEILIDFKRLTENKISQDLDPSNRISGKHPFFIEEGADIRASVFNTDEGPVYIGKNAKVMEGCLIRGPFALGEGASLKMGAKIYGGTTVGPYCKAGGELNNVVMFGNANKAHEGFLGNAVIGEWCNIGADSNNSNLKNTYEEVKMWSYRQERFVSTGLQFAGLIMGDHSKCGINTMFNTGTVVGVNCNIYGAGFQRNFIPSFSWGGASGFQLYDLDKAMKVAENVMIRRGTIFDNEDAAIFNHLHGMAKDRIRH
jgi:UDP-N-acetylglucosamine diphosphorylase/glucosamine-1-phosphate N-acetyltransferase